jgi:hypothetical protein
MRDLLCFCRVDRIFDELILPKPASPRLGVLMPTLWLLPAPWRRPPRRSRRQTADRQIVVEDVRLGGASGAQTRD